MKHTLFRRFLIIYIFIGVVGLVITEAGGFYLVENHLEDLVSTSLKNGAEIIASEKDLQNGVTKENQQDLLAFLNSVSASLDATIWLIDENNRIVLESDRPIPEDPEILEDLVPENWEGDSYRSGSFYGHFSSPHISVLSPIRDGEKGYVAIHYLTGKLYQRRRNVQEIMLIIFTVVYAFNFLILLLFRKYVDKPLQLIAKGGSEYAKGNLAYTIPVNSEDELGYLAQTLNYMAERLNKSGEYQRQFISNVSHDFRSPLTSIRGYTDAMLDGTIPLEMQEKYLKVISYETARLEKLTGNLLALNAFDPEKPNTNPQRFDINEVLKDTASVFEGTCSQHSIRLELLLNGHELFAYADKAQIQQVVYNLLDNAIKFSDSNASITMETTEKNGRIFVSVKDEGCGVPKEDIPRIWDRFYKSDASRGKDRKGSGLGLSIVREIINAHGQTINVISTEGVGSEFIFTLEKAK